MNNTPFINTNHDLSSYCETLVGRKVIALDTEFLRVNTFYPKPGLFQLNDGENIVLIDPCTITEWEEFKAILVNPAIVKVFHACDEDIELLYHFLDVEPQSVFDTQVAAAFCGYDFCMGYQRLISAMLNVELEKTSSRSDWMQRPLTEKQIHYAVDDVRYLLPVYEILQKAMSEKNLDDIMDEEYQTVIDNIKSTDFDNAYTRIKEAWKLSPKQFAVLKALATWREKMMRERDMPRKKIAGDEALMALAMRDNWNIHQLYSVEGLPGATVKNIGHDILELIAQVAQFPTDAEVMGKPIRSDALMHKIKTALHKLAKDIAVDEKMLGKKFYNEQLYLALSNGNDYLPDVIKGWRRPYYEKIRKALKQDTDNKSVIEPVLTTGMH